MRLIVHIGSTKTGSSAIQHFMHANRKALLAQGVLYPDIGVKSGAHHLLAALTHQTALKMHAEDLSDDADVALRNLCQKLKADASKAKAKLVVISSEYLWTANQPQRFARAMVQAGFETFEVLAYVRELGSWLRSQYGQAVKSGLGTRFDQWLGGTLRNPYSGSHYAKTLASWDRLSQVTNVSARVYGKAALPRGLLADFLETIGADPTAFDTTAFQRTNPSASTAGTELMALANQLTLTGAQRSKLQHLLVSGALKRESFDDYRPLHQQDLKRVTDALAPEVQLTKQHYLVAEHRGFELLSNRSSSERDRTDDLAGALLRLLVETAL